MSSATSSRRSLSICFLVCTRTRTRHHFSHRIALIQPCVRNRTSSIGRSRGTFARSERSLAARQLPQGCNLCPALDRQQVPNDLLPPGDAASGCRHQPRQYHHLRPEECFTGARTRRILGTTRAGALAKLAALLTRLLVRCGASVSSSLQSLHWPTLLMEGCVSHCHSSCCVTLASSALTLAVVMCRCWRAFRSMRLK